MTTLLTYPNLFPASTGYSTSQLSAVANAINSAIQNCVSGGVGGAPNYYSCITLASSPCPSFTFVGSSG